MNKYLEILELIKSKEYLRESLRNPFIGGKYVAASDGKSLVYFVKELLPENTDFPISGKFPDISEFVNLIENKSDLLSLHQLKSIIEKCPMVEEIKEEKIECEECNGSGEVDYTYEDRKRVEHIIEQDCPSCNGDGGEYKDIPTGKMIKDNNYYIYLNNCILNIELVENLIKLSEILESAIILVRQNGERDPLVFKLGEVKFILMPRINIDKEFILDTIIT